MKTINLSSSLLVVELFATISGTANGFTTPLTTTTSTYTRSPMQQQKFSRSKMMTTQCNAMLGGGFDAIDTFYQTAPYCAAFLTCSVKGSAADMVAQTRKSNSDNNKKEQEREQDTKQIQLSEDNDNDTEVEFDFLRNLAFLLYGGFYQGMGQTFLYAHLYPALFGTTPTVLSVLGQASFECFLLAPFFCLPTVYTMKALLAGKTPADGISKYIQHISSQHILYRHWSIWFPVQCLNFAVVPEHLRVPFGACVSFFWVCMLSSISAREGSSETVTGGTVQAHTELQPQEDIALVLEQAMEEAMAQAKLHPFYQQVQQWVDGDSTQISPEPSTLSPLRPALVHIPAYNQTLP